MDKQQQELYMIVLSLTIGPQGTRAKRKGQQGYLQSCNPQQRRKDNLVQHPTAKFSQQQQMVFPFSGSGSVSSAMPMAGGEDLEPERGGADPEAEKGCRP